MAGPPGTPATNGLDQIGNTPIQAVALLIDGRWRTAHLKLEGHNPLGSIKNRTALALITDLKRRGELTAGSTVVESTSGNLGVALAAITRAWNHPFTAVVDPKVTPENLARMRDLGATIEMVTTADEAGSYLESRLQRVSELCAASPRYVWTDQYSNPANPLAHYLGTGPEIHGQLDREIDAIFVPVSTGGTLAGVGRFFRKARPTTRIVAVDARGSVIFGGPPGPRRLTGIGSSRRPRFVEAGLHDHHMLVDDGTAFALCRLLASETGIRVGGSSGAVLGACAQYLRAHPRSETVVCVCPDDGDNYASTIFNDDWLKDQRPHPGVAPEVPVTRIAIAGSRIAAPAGFAVSAGA